MKNAISNSPKIRPEFYCESCDYKCSKKSDFNKHLKSKKHNATKCYINASENSLNCICGKKYKHSSSFYRHKKTCKKNEEYEKNQEIEKKKKFEEKNKTEEKNVIEIDKINDTDEDIEYKQMFKQMMHENKEMRKTIQEILPKIGDQNSHNTSINNNFNINLFLNETCKDAVNLMDFVKSLQLRLKDLENMGKLGFVEGTSKIIIDGLKELDKHKRPIHCSNVEKEILYVKDNDTWEKENENKDKMKKAIDEINKANMKQIPKWITENPTYAEDEEYMKIISNIMKMDGENDKEKIINNVAQQTLIDE